MPMPVRPSLFWPGILAVAGTKLLLHLYVNTIYGFHRDELLYLALGQHPDWGYWSNPPLIGGLGWLVQSLGGALWEVRLLPTLAGCGLVVLAAAMARELGGGRYAQVLAGLAIFVSPAFLRTSMLFQPVVFDILGWTLMCYLLLRYLNTENRRYLYGFGLCFGLFFLNKYMVVFFLAALLVALVLTPQRRWLLQRDAWITAGLALLVMLPNLIWQYSHGFPVITHMAELSRNQLVNVQTADFLGAQLRMCLPAALVWIPGVWLLWQHREGKYRLLFYLFAGVILLLLIARGKHYYTLGIYPMALAAGGLFWENMAQQLWLRVLLPVVMFVLLAPVMPLSLPLLPPADMAAYCRWAAENLGLEGATRWEDGRNYPLPQDYADMLGWPELGEAAVKAVQLLPPGAPVLIYGENYGQAGAVDYFGRKHDLPPAVSFSDTYRLWMPDSTAAQSLIYINDELGEDVQSLFADIRPVGSITDSLAREFGTTVYLCRQPRVNLDSFWRKRVQEVRAE